MSLQQCLQTHDDVFSLLPDAFNAVIQAAGDLHQPALLISLSKRSLVHLHGNQIHSHTDTRHFPCSCSVREFMGKDSTETDLRDHTNTTGDDGSFCLSSTHAPQTGGHKHASPQVIRAQVPAAGIQHGELQGDAEGKN